jgi:hypothetical protein
LLALPLTELSLAHWLPQLRRRLASTQSPAVVLGGINGFEPNSPAHFLGDDYGGPFLSLLLAPSWVVLN